jgi:hypothetical protein
MAKYDLFGTGATPIAPTFVPAVLPPPPSTKPKKQRKKQTNNESVSYSTNETSLQLLVSVLNDLNNVITEMMNDDEPTFLSTSNHHQPTLFHDLVLESDDDDDEEQKPAVLPTPSLNSNTASESTDSAMFSSLSILADTCLFGYDSTNNTTMTDDAHAEIYNPNNNKENEQPSSSNINKNNPNNDCLLCLNSASVY